MSKSPKGEAQARAEASFKRKEERVREGKVAMAEYEASTRATRDKTTRLRELRLAKEAADLEAAKNAPPPVKPVKPAPKVKPVAKAKPAPKAKPAAKEKKK